MLQENLIQYIAQQRSRPMLIFQITFEYPRTEGREVDENIFLWLDNNVIHINQLYRSLERFYSQNLPQYIIQGRYDLSY